MHTDDRRRFGSTAAILDYQSALSLTFRASSETVIAGEGSPSAPLFSHAEGVDADPHRHDGRCLPRVKGNIARYNSYRRLSAFIRG